MQRHSQTQQFQLQLLTCSPNETCLHNVSIYFCCQLLNPPKIILNTEFKGTHLQFVGFIMSPLRSIELDLYHSDQLQDLLVCPIFSEFATLNMFAVNKMSFLFQIVFCCIVKKLIIYIYILLNYMCVFFLFFFFPLVLPAWRMAAFEREKTANILCGGFD